jgi:membrane-bound metal-dependent hydrolase YbcI (DUF457 family)
MDNITHTLFALTLARTPLGRAGRGTTAALVIASNAPDFDVVATLGGAGQYLTWHRGPTHGPLGIVGLGVIAAGLVWAGLRRSNAKAAGLPDASFQMLVAVSIVGALFHVLLDLPTAYGTRLLSPFDWRWFTFDWIPIIDIYLWVVLVAGLMFGRASAAARRRNAAIVLVLMTANYGVRAVAHHQALVSAPRLFGPPLPERCDPPVDAGGLIDYWPARVGSSPRGDGHRCLIDMIAVPTFLSPFKWRVITHLSNAYEIHDIDLLDSRFDRSATDSEGMWRTTLRFPNVWTPPVFAAAATPLGQTFLGFSRLPAARSFVDSAGTATVRWTDMRFVGSILPIDQPVRPADPFSLVVRMASDGHVIDTRLGP